MTIARESNTCRRIHRYEQNKYEFFAVTDLKVSHVFQVNTGSGAQSSPLQLVSYWKCEDSHTDLRIDYKYNPHAIASPSPLLNLNIMVPVDGVVSNMQSKPSGQW